VSSLAWKRQRLVSSFRSSRRHGDEANPHCPFHLGQQVGGGAFKGCQFAPHPQGIAGGRPSRVIAHQAPGHRFQAWLSWWSANIDVFVAVFAQGETRSPCWRQRRRASIQVVSSWQRCTPGFASSRSPTRPQASSAIPQHAFVGLLARPREPSPTWRVARASEAGSWSSKNRRP